MALVFHTEDGVKDLSRFDRTLSRSAGAIVGRHIELGVNDYITAGNLGYGVNATATLRAWIYHTQHATARGQNIVFFNNNAGWNPLLHQSAINDLLYFSGSAYFAGTTTVLKFTTAWASSP